jgi:DHA1 family multidrug resistance protein-like MFS transporter
MNVYTMTQPWKTNFAAVLIAETLAIMGFAVSMPVIPLFLEEDIGITNPQSLKIWVGLVQSSAAITFAIFAPIWGHLADIYSRRLMLMRAMFGGAVVVSLMIFVQAPWQILVLRGIQGAVTGTVSAATILTVGIAPAAQLAMALGLLQTGVAVGNTLGPLVGGLISDFLGHRIAFLGTGLILVAAGLIVLKGVTDDTRSDTDQRREKRSAMPDIKPILASPILITMLAVSFSIQAANTIAEPMLPLFLKQLALKGATGANQFIGSSTGIVLGIGAVATAIAAVLVGKYATRFGYWKTLIFCLGAGAVLTVPQAFVSNMVQLAVFRGLASFFIGGAAPVLSAIIAMNTVKETQGSVYGFNSSITSAGGALGPAIGSALAMVNYQMVFLGTALMLGLSAYGAMHRKRKLENDQST